MKIDASPSAIEHIAERGGRLFVWRDAQVSSTPTRTRLTLRSHLRRSRRTVSSSCRTSAFPNPCFGESSVRESARAASVLIGTRAFLQELPEAATGSGATYSGARRARASSADARAADSRYAAG